MIAVADFSSPTRDAGILSHLLAAAVCARVVRTSRSLRRFAMLLGLLEAFLCLDAVFNWRWQLHGFLMGEAQQRSVYQERAFPQEIALSLVLAAAVAVVFFGFRRSRSNPGAGLTIAGTVISIACWCAEVISLHLTDAILQRSVGPVMVVAMVWIATSAMVAGGLLWATESRLRRKAARL